MQKDKNKGNVDTAFPLFYKNKKSDLHSVNPICSAEIIQLVRITGVEPAPPCEDQQLMVTSRQQRINKFSFHYN